MATLKPSSTSYVLIHHRAAPRFAPLRTSLFLTPRWLTTKLPGSRSSPPEHAAGTLASSPELRPRRPSAGQFVPVFLRRKK
ncbi:hypothetical protein Zm00014a_007763 [Zea mays]|uniref:Uncharacterized protein n=1 Tax=Zea mays TaxID=4577 RepID=A0A3L6FBA6_MAIZE|nr:hypothetical protein Zm00014a_007763 [Zea mays]